MQDSCNFKTFILLFFTWDYLKLVCVRKLTDYFESSWFSFELSWKKEPPKNCTQPLREVQVINGVLWPILWVDYTKTVHIHISLDDLLYSVKTNVISCEYLRLVEENICNYSWIQKWSSAFQITVSSPYIPYIPSTNKRMKSGRKWWSHWRFGLVVMPLLSLHSLMICLSLSRTKYFFR